MSTKKPRRESPTVSGRKMTFKDLGALLGMTPANAAQKYYRIRKDYGKVTMVQMQSPYRSPRVTKRVQANLLARERERLVAHARQHGPTHTSLKFGVDTAYVKRLVAQADRKGA